MTADSDRAAAVFDQLDIELTNAVDVLTSENFRNVDSIAADLEPFVGRLEDLQEKRSCALNQAELHALRRKLHRLNEVATHLHLVYRGMFNIGRLADGGYGPDGRFASSTAPSLRGEG